MGLMELRYTYDVESVDLTDDELAVFGETVRYLCVLEAQNQMSVFLSMIVRPQGPSVLDFVGRQAPRMWRAESKV